MKTDPDTRFLIVISGDEPYYPLHPSGIQPLKIKNTIWLMKKESGDG
ncbi:hypothetical protein ASZ90_015754 [hydrocarbon metagenome]|uniref:Uncharacterized protein n=1 Tax=hydrocarbon metagenome TaxID=938273 RepID=A0A0W8F183_9ZZZZ